MENTTEEISKARTYAIDNIKCYHKDLPKSYVDNLSVDGLLAYVHPQDRERIGRLFGKSYE